MTMSTEVSFTWKEWAVRAVVKPEIVVLPPRHVHHIAQACHIQHWHMYIMQKRYIWT